MPRQKKGADGYYRMTFSIDGKQYSVRSKDPKKLSEKMAAKIKEASGGRKLISESTTVKEWAKEWMETYNAGMRPASKARLNGMILKYIQPEIGLTKVKDVRPVHCQRVLNGMDGLAKDTVKKVRSLLFNMFAAALDNSLCKTNPAAKLALPNTAAQSTHRSITDRERKIIIETAKTHPAGPWVLLLLYTGLRPAESVVLTGADIVGGKVRVNKALDRLTGQPKEPKSKAGYRNVPIIQPLREALPRVGIADLLFPAAHGGIRNSKSIARWWASFMAAMAETEIKMIVSKQLSKLSETVPPLVPYDLRHTYCTDLERAGVPINVASQLMGHSSIEVTAKIYTHTAEDVFADAATKLETLQKGDVQGDVHNTSNQPQSAVIIKASSDAG